MEKKATQAQLQQISSKSAKQESNSAKASRKPTSCASSETYARMPTTIDEHGQRVVRSAPELCDPLADGTSIGMNTASLSTASASLSRLTDSELMTGSCKDAPICD